MSINVLYTAKAQVSGGRDGHARSSDGAIDVDLSTPKELGGAGKAGASNPEQLFAAGYAACFQGAVRFVAGTRKIRIEQSSVDAEVGIGPRAAGGFGITVKLAVSLPGVERAVAEDLVKTAHEQICPYSHATRGNVDVDIVVV
jgi:Ohr subfamily peroxiredoxin